MRDVKATGRSRGENENGGIRVGSRLGKKGRLCRKTFVRLLCLTAAMMVLGSFTAFARAGGASGGGGGGFPHRLSMRVGGLSLFRSGTRRTSGCVSGAFAYGNLCDSGKCRNHYIPAPGKKETGSSP